MELDKQMKILFENIRFLKNITFILTFVICLGPCPILINISEWQQNVFTNGCLKKNLKLDNSVREFSKLKYNTMRYITSISR